MQQYMTIEKNERIAADVYRMVLLGDTSDITMPGQFVNIALPGFYLRRPISVCDWKNGELVLIYKAVGNGTEYMAALEAGTKLDILSGLGHGFETEKAGNAPLLVGGGVGTPPMYGLAKRMVLAGKPVNVILGFGSAADAFYAEEFEALNDLYDFGCEGYTHDMTEGGLIFNRNCKDISEAGNQKEGRIQRESMNHEDCRIAGFPQIRVYMATVDGSLGKKGFVTDCLDEIHACSHYYACGPVPMLKALKAAMEESFHGIIGELSLEERMGCGFGACVGCSVMTKEGAKKVCSDGPVFEAECLMF